MEPSQPTLLPYETPRQSPRVRIERFADGGVTVYLRQARLDRQRLGLTPLLLAAFASAWVIFYVARRMPDYHDTMIILGGLVIAAVASLIAIRAVRSTLPTVIGVSARGVYVDHPQWLVRRRRHFRREELVILQPVTSERLARNQRRTGVYDHALEVQFRHGPHVWLLEGADLDEVRLASDALREALGIDPPSPSPTAAIPPASTPRA